MCKLLKDSKSLDLSKTKENVVASSAPTNKSNLYELRPNSTGPGV